MRFFSVVAALACRLLVVEAFTVSPSSRFGGGARQGVRPSKAVLDRGFVEDVVTAVSPCVCRVQHVTPAGKATWRGTGFVVRSDDEAVEVVTSSHAAPAYDGLSVALHDGTAYPARVVARNQKADVALLRVETDGQRVVPVARAGGAGRLGEFAVGLGYNAHGFSATLGVVAAVSDAKLVADNAATFGMSGGPLCDAEGRVLGALTTRDNLGSCYAPAALCWDLVEQACRKKTQPSTVRGYNVVLYNDPVNTRQHVEDVLVNAGLNQQAANLVMTAAHTTGAALVASYSTDADATDLCRRLCADNLVADVRAAGEDHDDPLQQQQQSDDDDDDDISSNKDDRRT